MEKQTSLGNSFSQENKFIPDQALAYDDVLVVPRYSEILPKNTNLGTQFSRNIVLNIPFVTAAMDTVTESPMAIAMARYGGIGVIHKNMTIELQAAEVRAVKRSDYGMIFDPITIESSKSVKDVFDLMKSNKIGGIPVVDDGILMGIITNRDVRHEIHQDKLVKNTMTGLDKLIVVNTQKSISELSELFSEHKIEKLPFIDTTGKLIGLYTLKDLEKAKNNPNAAKDSKGRLLCAAAVGVAKDAMERVDALVSADVDVLVLDSAHGHSKGIIDLLKKIKAKYPHVDVVAGNIATGVAAEALKKAGADGVKVGIGPGSICKTRIIAGIGVPQLYAILDVARALAGSGIPITADGGIRYPGDVLKALVAGGSAVMIGSIAAGTDETPGDTIIYESRKYKKYRGMGSIEAMEHGRGGRYFQDDVYDVNKLVSEGVPALVPCKGPLSSVLHEFIGGLRAGMGYTGCEKIHQLWACRFCKITSAGIAESHPHSLMFLPDVPSGKKQ